MQKKVMFLIGFALLQAISLFAQPQPTDEVVWIKFYQDLGLEEIKNAVFAPNEQSILVTDANLKLIEINVATAAVIRELPDIKGIAHFSSDGQYAYTYDFKKIRWPSLEVVGQFEDEGKPLQCCLARYVVDFDDKANVMIVTGSTVIRIFDLNTLNVKARLKQLYEGVNPWYFDIVTAPGDGKHIWTGAFYIVYNPPTPPKTYYNAFLWDLATLDTIKVEDDLTKLGGILMSPNGLWLGNVDVPYVQVFDGHAFTENHTFVKIYEWQPGSSVCVNNAIAWTSDSRYMATKGPNCWTDEDNVAKIRVWDLLHSGNLAYKYNTALSTDYLQISKNNQILTFATGGIILLNWMLPLRVYDKQVGSTIISPNPTTGEITLKNLPLKSGNIRIELTDITGKLIRVLYDGFYNQEELTFNLSDIPSGSYILQAKQGSSIKTFKVLKEGR